MEQHDEIFRDRLKELMEINEKTVKDISENTGISGASIYGYLSGLHLPNTEIAIRIADYFLCPLDFLFGLCNDFIQKERRIVSDITTRLKAAFDSCGKTRYRISKETRFSEGRLYRWYHGKVVPSIYNLVKLVEPLNCSLDFLVGRE